MAEAPDDTFEPAVHVERGDGRQMLRKRRALYFVSTGLLSLIVALAVVEGAGVADVYGVDTAHVRAAGGGYHLDVRYATVSRPGLATPFEITVRRPGGFDGPVVVAVDSAYLSMWDENGFGPQPAAETTDGQLLIWEFDTPRHGETLVVSYDGRIEPAVQWGKAGRVAVLDADGAPQATVAFRTRILP